MITCKSPRELDKMRESASVTARALRELKAAIRPGMTTRDIDELAARTMGALGGESAFLGYQGFAGSICTSVNEEVVHGIPGKRTLKDGDVLKIDIGARVDGWYSDMACTLAVGHVSAEARKLMEVTEAALYEGIREVRAGAHVSDIGHAIQAYVEHHGFAVVRALVGHGIGSQLHEDPPVPNYGQRGLGPILRSGMVLAIEPMVNVGTWRVQTRPDQWTVVTADGRLAAHFEHTVAVTPAGYEILTLTSEERAQRVDAAEAAPAAQRRAL
jgi:methionyl aminopeptidase